MSDTILGFGLTILDWRFWMVEVLPNGIIDFEALVVKVRQKGRVINQAIHLVALAVNLAGQKERSGLCMTQNGRYSAFHLLEPYSLIEKSKSSIQNANS